MSAPASTSCWRTCAQDNAQAAADVLADAGYEVSVATVDVSSRSAVAALVAEAARAGRRHRADPRRRRFAEPGVAADHPQGRSLRHRAGAGSLRHVIARGGAGVVIASQSGHRLPALTTEQNRALATTPVEELLGLPFLQPDR